MSIQKKKKYPLNHALDAQVPLTVQEEHTTLSDIDVSDKLLEIENAIAYASGILTTTISETEADELADIINTVEHMNNIVYEGPRLRDAKERETPAHSNAD